MSLFQKTEEDKAGYLTKLFNEVYFKDISERYNVKYPHILEELTDVLCSSVGSPTNASKLQNTLKTVKKATISDVTLSKYLGYLTDAFLFSKAKRYDVKGKKHFEYPSKFYCTDIGLRNARLSFRQQEETHIMENVIYNELICRDFLVDVGVVETVETKDDKKRKSSMR